MAPNPHAAADARHQRALNAQHDHDIALERAAGEITAALLDGQKLNANSGFGRYELDHTELLEHIDVAALVAAYKHGLTGQHAAAVRIFSTAMREAAEAAGEKYAGARLAYLSKAGL